MATESESTRAPAKEQARPQGLRVLSGIQPTADSFQLGNYLGALRHWVELQNHNDAFYCVVDQHAITVRHDPDVLRRRTLSSFAQLLAAGVDPNRSTLFVQSHVPEHSQLQWVLACLTGFGEAGRMTQFKDKSARQEDSAVTVGLYTYPILQAADILVYQADAVPVGEDQRQHLELTRDLAARFNSRFGDTFNLPRPHILRDTAKIYDLQEPGSKMSKSAPAGCVFLLDPPKRIAKQIKSAVTDSLACVQFDPENQPGVSNLITIVAALRSESIASIVEEFGGTQYGPLKVAAAEAVVALAEDYQRKTEEYLADPAELHRIMVAGAHRAREVAAKTVDEVYDRVGFVRR